MTNRKENSQRTLSNAVTQVQSPDARSFAMLKMTHSSEHTTLQPIPCGLGIMGGVCEWTMEQYLGHVRSTFYHAQVDGMRRETDPERKNALKKKLFWILPQGRIKPGHRQVLGTQPTKEDIEYAPWQMLDLDTLPEGCDTPADAWYKMRHRLHAQGLAHYPMVVMESCSGKGLHIYVRLTEEMRMMNRREVIALWNEVLDVEFDPSVTDPARRAFQSYNLFSADSEIALLFGAELTDEQREAMKKTPSNLPLYGEALQTSRTTNSTNTPEVLPIEGAEARASVALTEPLGSQKRLACESTEGLRGSIASRLVINLCGTTTPPEGTRNTTLYEAAKQMAYLEGITEEKLIEAFRPIAFLGLPEGEARTCIRSAMKREKTWKYITPPELKKAMEETHPIPHREDLGGSTPTLIQLFTPLVPENTREAAASMIFAPLGAYLNNTVEIRDVSNKRRKIQFTSIIVGNSSTGKGFSDQLSDLITERLRQRDISLWAQIDAWQEQKHVTPKGSPTPVKPQVPIRLLEPNMTEPALLERLKCLEPTAARGYIKVSEIDQLRKMQSVNSSRLGAGQDIILSAFDTAAFGAMRVSSEAVSGHTVMSLNIVAASTFPGTQDFFHGGIERGSVGRCDISIVPPSYDVPRYTDPDADFYAQLNIYLDRLEQATGLIENADIDRTIEEIRQSYHDANSPLSHHQNAEYFTLSHRQLLITKQKATILYICNNYQWDTAWEPWLHHAFYYGMQCKIEVFNAEIDSWLKRQCAASAPRIIKHGPKSELDSLPQTFTLADLVDYKRSVALTPMTDEQITEKAKSQLRKWKTRGHIQETDEAGKYSKTT